MMGAISSRSVVTDSENRGRPKTVQQGDREWASIIQDINAKGWAIPPFIILSGRDHLLPWYKEQDAIPKNWSIEVSETSWTNNELGLRWLKHFDECTKRRTVGTYRLLILDGHQSHNSTEFHRYCEEHKIIALCMPPHSSRMLQPLDVGCFAPMKKSYGSEAEGLMRNKVAHITKVEFLPCFKAAFDSSITKKHYPGRIWRRWLGSI